MATPEVNELFKKSDPEIFEIYQKLVKQISTAGKIIIEPKKTSIHIKNESAFLGVHPKMKWLDLNIVTEQPLKSSRITKIEQVSKHRYHNEIRLIDRRQVDRELLGWLKESYKLTAKL